MKGVEKILLFSMALAVMVGCAYGDPHENFVRNIVGRAGSKISDFESLRPSRRLSVRKLDNGTNEYRYSYSRTCVTIYIVDPKTDMILKSGFEGDKRDCVWNP
jgi:hypothetical protein